VVEEGLGVGLMVGLGLVVGLVVRDPMDSALVDRNQVEVGYGYGEG
jgi:hypothetical protein